MEAGVKIFGVGQLVANLEALGASVERASKDALWKAGAHLERELKIKLSRPGTGKTWPTDAKGKRYSTHVASAPGQPPAVMTGRLRSSITHNVTGRVGAELPDPGGGKDVVRGYVGTNVEYGAALEFGSSMMHPFGNQKLVSRIEPRPWLYVTIAENANEVARTVTDSLREVIRKAKKG